MNVEIKGNELIVSLPISPRPSKSGKTILVASTSGNIKTTVDYDGKPITVSVNAYVAK